MIFRDRSGEPIPLDDWLSLCADDDYRFIRQTKVGDYLVSTVWLGIDLNMPVGVPLLFETLVYRGSSDVACYRWSSEREALAGHHELVSVISAAEGGVPDARAETKSILMGD